MRIRTIESIPCEKLMRLKWQKQHGWIIFALQLHKKIEINNLRKLLSAVKDYQVSKWKLLAGNPAKAWYNISSNLAGQQPRLYDLTSVRSVLTVPSPCKEGGLWSPKVSGRVLSATAGSWSRHFQPHRGGSTVSGFSPRWWIVLLHLPPGPCLTSCRSCTFSFSFTL